jgi:hypothetical protein
MHSLDEDFDYSHKSTDLYTPQEGNKDIKYPSQAKIKKENIKRYKAAQQDIIDKFKRKVYLFDVTDRRYTQLKAQLDELYPPMSKIKAEYLARGEDPDTVDRLVNYINYPYLPSVRINKKQKKALLKLLKERNRDAAARYI